MASASAPSTSTRAATASRVVRPHTAPAGLSVAPRSATSTYDGPGARPVRTPGSKPGRLSVAGKRPPNVESKNRPVSGDLAAAHARLLPGTVVSVMGPTANTTAFARYNGAGAAGT